MTAGGFETLPYSLRCKLEVMVLAARKISYQRALPSAQVRFKDRMRDLMRDASSRIGGVLVRYADVDGRIPGRVIDDVLREAGEIVASIFVVDGRRSINADGVPLSPYGRALMAEIGMVTAQVVQAHEAYMLSQLDDVTLAYLRGGRSIREMGGYRLDQGDGHMRVIEQDQKLSREEVERLRIFSPNPLAEYEPAHTWVDPNGYRLSDRIWRTSNETRRKLDGLMAEMIREGKGSLEIARMVERFLIPGRAKLRTRKPYGTDASYDAMRLARTEIARAANQAAWVSAMLNPYVERIRARRSSTGQVGCPVCTPVAGPVGGEGVVYSVYSAVIGPYHPHCMCYIVPEVTDTPRAVTGNLRRMLEQAEAELLTPFLTPAAAILFIEMLLGESVAQILPQLLPMQPGLFSED